MDLRAALEAEGQEPLGRWHREATQAKTWKTVHESGVERTRELNQSRLKPWGSSKQTDIHMPRAVSFERKQKAPHYRVRASKPHKNRKLLATYFCLGIAMVAVFLLFSPARHAETLEFNSGDVRVVDADTLAAGAVRVRLKGIAAAERWHPTLEEAKGFVGRLLRESEYTVCDLTNERTYGRRVGRCYFVDGEGNAVDVQREVVAAGYARACMRYGGWRYLTEAFNAEDRNLPLPGYCIGFSPF